MNDYLLLSELCREPLLTTEEAAVETRVPGHRITTHAVRSDFAQPRGTCRTTTSPHIGGLVWAGVAGVVTFAT